MAVFCAVVRGGPRGVSQAKARARVCVDYVSVEDVYDSTTHELRRVCNVSTTTCCVCVCVACGVCARVCCVLVCAGLMAGLDPGSSGVFVDST